MKIFTCLFLILSLFMPLSANAQGCANYKGYRGNNFNKENNLRFDSWMLDHSKRFNKSLLTNKLHFKEEIISCSFSINKNGEVVDIHIKESNSSSKLNQLALETLKESKPLPKDLVPFYKDRKLGVNFGRKTKNISIKNLSDTPKTK